VDLHNPEALQNNPETTGTVAANNGFYLKDTCDAKV